MDENKSVLRKKQIKNILVVVLLVIYVFFIYQVWELCQYGGLYSHLIRIVPALCILLVGLVIWIFLRFNLLKNNEKHSSNRYFSLLTLIGFISITLFFGGKIVYSAIPYNGALSWKLDEFCRKKRFHLLTIIYMKMAWKVYLQN
ncbi:hypothetical protein SAMN02745245_00370 [Anaerosphaera aminiphila DSM 21120]|uniref:Uncharacterized protein n=1 Tax=Anaerosphaera aminiphila DSM 21120 TaxID=1120995 RepID=A0A1M5PKT2_9FIRM|nr:hypothetical protein [Anaerosphaera aminiphila]SHH02358.1 hypothetical protein SAMN02745245_00370 [Anaerosphaera aminiphila DSM 21120]